MRPCLFLRNLVNCFHRLSLCNFIYASGSFLASYIYFRPPVLFTYTMGAKRYFFFMIGALGLFLVVFTFLFF